MDSKKYSLPVEPHTLVSFVPMSKKSEWTDDYDIRHCIKYLLYPHVSTALDFGDDGLNRHKIGRAVFFAAIFQYQGRTDEEHKLNQDDFKKYLKHITDVSGEELGEYARQGTDLHNAVEGFYMGKGYPSHEGAQNIIAMLAPRIKSLGVVRVVCEKVIVNHEIGFMGTPDLVGYNSEGRVVWIGDMKQVNDGKYNDFKTSKSLYEKYRAQLAAYSLLLKAEDHVVEQVLSNRQTNECKLIPHDNHDTMIEATRLHIMGWCMRKYGFLPGPAAKERHAEMIDTWNRIAEYNKGIVQK